MARGNFWEATYDPEWNGPEVEAEFGDMPRSTGMFETRLITSTDQAAQVRWTRKSPARRFERCDFAVRVRKSLVSNCTFIKCRFKGSYWDDVKFSNCSFVRCDFSECTFVRCIFIRNCHFDSITASAELFTIEDTAISSRAFMRGLKPNLMHVSPPDRQPYQLYRFVRTRQKIAKALYHSTRNESDVDYYHEAYEELTRATLQYRVEEYRFDEHTEKRASPIIFALRSFPARTERTITIGAGWLTDWGRSVLRALGFFIVVVLAFVLVYSVFAGTLRTGSWKEIGDALIESLNVTLVAGYTSYFDPDASLANRIAWTVNVVLGLFWYSLIVPVVARRILS